MQVVPVLCGSERLDGRLIMINGAIIAVLTHLQGEHYLQNDGGWFLEAGFGPCEEKGRDPFPSLEAATEWIQTVTSG